VFAVPAFIATSTAEALLPAGLGFAAGAMAWLALFDMIPEAAEDLDRRRLIPAVVAGIALMAAVTLVG
jgi:zinc transporter ZupT